MNDENSDILEVHLIKTRYINAFNKCSLTEEDMNETINNFKEFPYIKDCNESINYWQKRFLECRDKFKEIKIVTSHHVSIKEADEEPQEEDAQEAPFII